MKSPGASDRGPESLVLLYKESGPQIPGSMSLGGEVGPEPWVLTFHLWWGSDPKY